MEKYFLNLTQTEFEDMDSNLDDICRENEKFKGSALFFLVVALKSSHNIIALCTEVIKTKQFHKEHNLYCGLNMHFEAVDRILTLNYLPEELARFKEIKIISDKADIYFDKLIDKKFKSVIPNLKIQSTLYDLLENLIWKIIADKNLLESFKDPDKDSHVEIAKFIMNTSRYNRDVAEFFLKKFVYVDAA